MEIKLEKLRNINVYLLLIINPINKYKVKIK